jgi:competence protein ComEC
LGPAAAFHDTRSDPNNSSLVLRATIAGVRILLPGDAEVEAQQELLDQHVDVTADVLKVPHHGSAYSLPAFLAAVHAQVGVISVGLNNDYGHPSPVLLDALARMGMPVRRTDHDGDVAVAGVPGAITTVVRGTRASTVGLGFAGVEVVSTAHEAMSPGDDRMGACQLARSASTSCPRFSRPSWFSSVTRNFWSLAPSARSPPPLVGPTRSWS